MTDADLTLRDEVAEVLHGLLSPNCSHLGNGLNALCERYADALLPLLARETRCPLTSHDGTHGPLIRQAKAEGEARVRERVEAVLDPVARSEYVSGRRGGKTFLGQFVAELRAALAEPAGEQP